MKYESLGSGYVNGMATYNRIWDGNMTGGHSTGRYKGDRYNSGGYESDDHKGSGEKYYLFKG